MRLLNLSSIAIFFIGFWFSIYNQEFNKIVPTFCSIDYDSNGEHFKIYHDDTKMLGGYSIDLDSNLVYMDERGSLKILDRKAYNLDVYCAGLLPLHHNFNAGKMGDGMISYSLTSLNSWVESSNFWWILLTAIFFTSLAIVELVSIIIKLTNGLVKKIKHNFYSNDDDILYDPILQDKAS